MAARQCASFCPWLDLRAAVVWLGAACVVIAGLAMGAVGASAQDTAPEVLDVRFGVDGVRTRVVVETSRPLDYRVFTLEQGGARVVLDLEPVRWRLSGQDIGAGQHARPGSGTVARARFAHASARHSRLVFDLSDPALVREHFILGPATPGGPHRLVLDLVQTDARSFSRAAGFPSEAVPRVRQTVARALEPRRQGMQRRKIVIDPGHGGRDPGATGVAGLKEKDVNLAVALSLAEALRQSGFDVALTRADDTYVSLQDRVAFARQAEADLFISLHADSSPSGAAVRGASVYTLSDAAEARAQDEILTGDNWLINVQPDAYRPEVNEILVDLAQRETQNASAAFAETLIPQLRSIGPVLRNTHRRAGLYVLLAPDVPAVLVEMGFLSNPEDERLLRDRGHRARLVTALTQAIDGYFAGDPQVFAQR